MKRFWIGLLVLCMISVQPAVAENSELVTILARHYVSLREYPSTSAPAVMRIPAGATATCLDFYDMDDDSGFYHIEYKGYYGYVLADYVARYVGDDEGYDDEYYGDEDFGNESFDDEGYDDESFDDEYYDDEYYDDEDFGDESFDEGGSRQVYLTGDVNIRSGPGLYYEAISTASKGRRLTYQNSKRYDDRGVAWYKVRCSAGNGWVSSRYARLERGGSSWEPEPDDGASPSASTRIYHPTDALRNNIDQAIWALNGTYVSAYGDFSFNDTVGPRTEADGYEIALNGRGVNVIAGGVSQVASTLYLALKDRGGVYYMEKQVYGRDYTGSYVASSSDAIVTDYANGVDFSFSNNGRGFTINMWREGNRVYCQLDA